MRWLGKAAFGLLITGILTVLQLVGGVEQATGAVFGGYTLDEGVILDQVSVMPPFDEVDVRLLAARYLQQKGISLASGRGRGELILNLAVSGQNQKTYHWYWLLLWPFHGLATDHVTLSADFTVIDPAENRMLAKHTVKADAYESALFSDFRPVEWLYKEALQKALDSGAAGLVAGAKSRR